jgi:hypothetical protein
MENKPDQHDERSEPSLDSRLEQIARGTTPPPARLPENDPGHIPATTYDSNVIASLVMGIISIVICCIPYAAIPLAIVGLYIGLWANAHGMAASANTGVLLNAIGLALSVILGILMLLGIMQMIHI